MVKVRGGEAALSPELLDSALIGQQVSLATLSQAGWRGLREVIKPAGTSNRDPGKEIGAPYGEGSFRIVLRTQRATVLLGFLAHLFLLSNPWASGRTSA